MPTPCRLWQGRLNTRGYGVRPDQEEIHRWVMRMAGHDIAGKHVLHRCDQPLCFRYDHLFIGTQADNMTDKVAKGRQSRGEAHGEAMRRWHGGEL